MTIIVEAVHGVMDLGVSTYVSFNLTSIVSHDVNLMKQFAKKQWVQT